MCTDFKAFGLHLLRLLPFLLFLVLYFAVVRDDTNVVLSTFLKCAPIISLIAFVLLKGTKFTAQYKYSLLILTGLAFSCGGDLLLNIDYFPLGMGSFAVAHIFYVAAFGLRPWKFWICVPFYLTAIGMNIFLFPYLEPILRIGFPIYAFLLGTMCWRSFARATEKRTILTWLCAFGSVLFLASDSMISVTMFVEPIPHDRMYIMVTYYGAQFLIALSTLSDAR